MHTLRMDAISYVCCDAERTVPSGAGTQGQPVAPESPLVSEPQPILRRAVTSVQRRVSLRRKAPPPQQTPPSDAVARTRSLHRKRSLPRMTLPQASRPHFLGSRRAATSPSVLDALPFPAAATSPHRNDAQNTLEAVVTARHSTPMEQNTFSLGVPSTSSSTQPRPAAQAERSWSFKSHFQSQGHRRMSLRRKTRERNSAYDVRSQHDAEEVSDPTMPLREEPRHAAAGDIRSVPSPAKQRYDAPEKLAWFMPPVGDASMTPSLISSASTLESDVQVTPPRERWSRTSQRKPADKSLDSLSVPDGGSVASPTALTPPHASKHQPEGSLPGSGSSLRDMLPTLRSVEAERQPTYGHVYWLYDPSLLFYGHQAMVHGVHEG